MYKVAYVSTVDGLKEARAIMKQIYDENPRNWPYGLTPDHFDGGVYLIREKQSNAPIGFCGWQERLEVQPVKRASNLAFLRDLGFNSVKVGYYSIGVLAKHRRNGFAKEALSKLIAMKAAGVDKVKAMIVSSNKPSMALADSLGVEKQIKRSSLDFYLRTRMLFLPQ
jgi:RimJ/RimL family protein N-acetyltransferase